MAWNSWLKARLIARHSITLGHRGPHEFEISLPRPGEDLKWVERQLAERAEMATSYRGLLEAQERKRAAAWAELERRHPMQARMLHHQLRGWAKISRDRERARSEVIRYFWVLRAYALKAGELTGLGEDNISRQGRNRARSARGNNQREVDQAATWRTSPTRPCRPIQRSFVVPSIPMYGRQIQTADQICFLKAVPASPMLPYAVSGSAGVVQAPVRVLRDAADGAALRAGEVLVTTITNVGWTPLFPRAAAVVTDVGAPLSHAAIVARELGIPAVVGCGNATMRLKTGDQVRVDGQPAQSRC